MVKQEKSAGAIIYCTEDKSFVSQKPKELQEGFSDINKEPKFLLVQNTLKTTYWSFPKGKIEENETIEETAKREIEEETSLRNLEVVKGFKHPVKWFFRFKGELISKETVYILIKIPEEDKNKVKINYENEDFAWLSYEEALEKIKIKSNKEMLKKANEFIINFEKQKRLI